MKQYDPSLPLFSIHIPKCGGTSFNAVLRSWFGRRLLRHYPNPKKNKLPKKHRMRRLLSKRYLKGLCVHGHFSNTKSFGVLQYYPEAKQFITMIRDPFEAHVSLYFYMVREGKFGRAFKNGKIHPIVENGWSLEEYLREMPKPFMTSLFPNDITFDNYKRVIDEQFLFVGITESLQASVNRLADILGFSRVIVPELNTTERSQEVPSGAREEFIDYNPLEIAIYNYALAQHCQQCEGLLASVGS